MRFDIHQSSKHSSLHANLDRCYRMTCSGIKRWQISLFLSYGATRWDYQNLGRIVCFIQLAVIWKIYLDFEMVVSDHTKYSYFMMTSSNGNIFRVTGPLLQWPSVTGGIPHKGQWGGALMFSLIRAWTSGWANNRDADDLRRHRAHYDVTVTQS